MANVTSAKTKGRLTRKELKQDKLVAFAYKAEQFYLNHRNLVIGVAIGIVVIVAGGWIIQKSITGSREDESFALSSAKMNYGSGDLDQAKTGFAKVIATFGGNAAGQAQYFLGRIAFDQGNYAQAEIEFRKYIKDYSVDDLMDCAAQAGLAATLESEGKLDEAAKTYEEAASKYPQLPWAAQGLLEAGRIYTKLNQPDKMKAVYQRIVDKYPDSAEAPTARKELD